MRSDQIMKSCPKCQTEMDDNERTCPQCGHQPEKQGFFGTLLGWFTPKSATYYLDLATDSFNRFDFSRAIVAYGKAFSLDPTLIPQYQAKLVLAHQYRADEYMRQRDAKRAIEDYSEAIRLNPASAVTLYGRGVANIRLDRIDQAIADCTEAIRLRPDYFPAYMGRAECFFKKGDLGQAIADDTEAIRIQPDSAAAYRGRGQLYSQQGTHDLAIADFTQAIRLDPENPHGYVLRAKEYRAIGDDASAADDERKAETTRK
jgi:tetratricopeptide (TPR) repeat protein